MGKYILILTDASGFSWVHNHSYNVEQDAHYQRFFTYGGAEFIGQQRVKQLVATEYQIVKVG